MRKPMYRYEVVLERALEFVPVVEAVEDHPTLPEPGGMSGSKMTWRKQVGDTIYLGRIMRLASESECVIFTVAYVTPATHAMLVNHGKQVYDEMLRRLENRGIIVAAVDRFARAWRELTITDRHPSPKHYEDGRSARAGQ